MESMGHPASEPFFFALFDTTLLHVKAAALFSR